MLFHSLLKVIILQKYYRRWLAKRYVTKLKEDKARRLEWEREEEMRKKREKEERIKRDYARRLNPKTKADFDMLLHCLESMFCVLDIKRDISTSYKVFS